MRPREVKVFLFVSMCIFTIGCKQRKESFNVEMPVLVDKSQPPVIGIYVYPTRHGPRTADELEPQVIIAVWPDGQVLWSKDLLQGGRPYYEGKIPAERINEFFKILSSRGIFKDPTRNHVFVGPDSDFTVIAIFADGKRVTMGSQHELYERPGVLATADGILALEGRFRDRVWAKQPNEYKRFRELWTVIRDAATELFPDEENSTKDLHFTIRTLSAE